MYTCINLVRSILEITNNVYRILDHYYRLYFSPVNLQLVTGNSVPLYKDVLSVCFYNRLVRAPHDAPMSCVMHVLVKLSTSLVFSTKLF